MVRYLYQSCNCTYVDNHKCFFYKNSENLYSVPHQEKSNENDAKKDDSKDEFKTNSNDKSEKITPEIQLSGTEGSEQVNSLLVKSYEQVNFKRALERQRNLFSFLDDASDNQQYGKLDNAAISDSTLKACANEDHSKEKSPPKYFSGNFGPYCIFENGSHGACTIKSNITVALQEQNNGETRSSTSSQNAFSEESDVSQGQKSWRPFINDKIFFMKNAHLDSRTLSEISSSPDSTEFSSGDKESNKNNFKVTRDRFDITIPPKVATRVLTKKATKFKEPPVSIQEKKSEIYTFEVSRELLDTPIPPEDTSGVVTKNATSLKKPISSMNEMKSENYPFDLSSDLPDIPKPPEVASLVPDRRAAALKKHRISEKEKESDKYIFDLSMDLPDNPFLPKVASSVLTTRGDKVNKLLVSMKDQSSMVGSFGINADLLQIENKEFSCDLCHKRFYWKSSFKQRYRSHTGEKPYKCGTCAKAFTLSGNRNKHYKLIHK